MTSHTVGTREEWRAARVQLLEAEKELTRRSDELARQRQALPWVRIDWRSPSAAWPPPARGWRGCTCDQPAISRSAAAVCAGS
jgi:Bacterial protein of unknown function (DUF899)